MRQTGCYGYKTSVRAKGTHLKIRRVGAVRSAYLCSRWAYEVQTGRVGKEKGKHRFGHRGRKEEGGTSTTQVDIVDE